MVRNFPFAVFKQVNERVSSLYLVASGSHGEFVDSSILAPIVSDQNIRFKDDTLWFFKKEGIEIIFDAVVVSSGSVTDSWKKNSTLCVSGSNCFGIESVESVVP